MIVPVGTTLRLDVQAAIGGGCQQYVVWCPPFGDCYCVDGPFYPRTIGIVWIEVDATTGGYFDGNHAVGSYACPYPPTCNEIDSRQWETHAAQYLPESGVYVFTFRSQLANPNCTEEVCTDTLERKATVYVGNSYVAPKNLDRNLGRPLGECVVPDLFVKNPINVATGNKFEEAVDLSVSTPGILLEFKRDYNSQSTYDGYLGHGWTHNFDLSLEVVQGTSPRKIIVWDADGRALHFSALHMETGGETEISFTGESGVKDRLKQVNPPTGDYFLRRKKGDLTYKFNGSDGKLLQILDINENTLTLNYIGGLLSQVSNNFGKTISIGYNAQGLIESVTDPMGKSVSYQYDSNGDLTKVTYPDRPTDPPDLFSSITYAYSNHNLTDKFDGEGNPIGHWVYYNNNETDRRKIRVQSYYSHLKDSIPQESIDLITYQIQDNQFPKTVVTRPQGTTTYTIAVTDGIHVVKEIEGCSTCGSDHKRFGYSDRADLISVTSFVGGNEITTEYEYDTLASPSEQVGEITAKREAVGWPEERTTSYAYTHRTDDPFLLDDKTETKPSVLVPGQNRVSKTTYTYSSEGDTISKEERGYTLVNDVPTLMAYTTTYQYNPYGQLISIDGPRTDLPIETPDKTTFEYYESTVPEVDNRYQLKAIVNAMGHRTEFSNYDAKGNARRIKDPNGIFTQYEYDERNRVKSVTNETTGAVTRHFYDYRGNIDYIILPEGNRIDYSYNLANKLTGIEDSLGNKIIYGYDLEGNRNREERRDTQEDLKKSLDFVYNAYNRLWKIINPDPESTFTEYTYNGNGNPTDVKDPNNNHTVYAYDKLNRLITTTRTEAILGEIITRYEYNTLDNQKKVTDPNGNNTQYTHDDFGRLNKTVSPDTGTTTYLYDEAGNLKQKIDAKGTVVNYTYDPLNRLKTVEFPSDPSQNIIYTYDNLSVTNGKGRLTGMTDPSGTYTFHYDSQGNLSREEKNVLGINYVTQYVYDKNNILSSITYPSNRTVTYVPDGTRRPSQVTTTLNGQPMTLASNISYLPYGGITSLTYGNNLSLTQGHDNQYRITSIVAGTVLNRSYNEYFPNGNVKKVTDNVDSSWNLPSEPVKTYSYNPGTNRLAGIQGGTTVTFGYDNNGNITSSSANNRVYEYDLSNQLKRVTENSVEIAQYAYNALWQRVKKSSQAQIRIFHYDPWGHMIAETDQNGVMLSEYIYLGDQLLAMITPGEVAYYFHNDHLGTPQIITDGSGNVAWKAVSKPFGEMEIWIEQVENPFRFPGQYYDEETGLNYNWHRYYDPTTGRYLTPDPIGLEGGLNLFIYGAGNPINYIDPDGLLIFTDCPKCWHYQDQIDEATDKCRAELNSCKTLEDKLKWVERYGGYEGTAMWNCVGDKTGNPNIWKDMTKACKKCYFLRGIRIFRLPLPRILP
jgi:RHS repeat-associated protein